MTSSNGNIFSVTGHLCGEFTGPGEFPAQRPVTWSFDVFFDLRPNKRLSKQWWSRWFETQSCPLWRHSNYITHSDITIMCMILPWLYGRYYKTDIRGAPSGKLSGKRVAIKDTIYVAGVPMMNGSRLVEGFVPTFDATVVTRILDAG